MALITLNEILPAARKGRYAVLSFNVVTLEMVDAVIQVAQNLRSPIIVGLVERHIGKVNPWLIAGAVLKGVERLDIPVAFHLDHAISLESVKLGIDVGCTSIMIDGSHLSFEDNIELTDKVTTFAHSKKVSVEAELGGDRWH